MGTVLVIAGSEQYLGAAEMGLPRCAPRRGRSRHRGGRGEVYPIPGPRSSFSRSTGTDDPLKTLAELSPKRAQRARHRPRTGQPRRAPYLPELIAQSDAPTVLDASALIGGEEWFAAVREHAALCADAAHGRGVQAPRPLLR